MAQMQNAVAHLVLAGTSLWGMRASPRFYTVSYIGTFGNILIHGITGFLLFGVPQFESHAPSVNLSQIFSRTYEMTRTLAFPCMVAQVYLQEGYDASFAHLHTLSGLVYVFLYFTNSQRFNTRDTMLIANAASMFYVSLKHHNLWGLGLIGCSWLTFYGMYHLQVDLPTHTLSAVCLCIFNFVAVNTILYTTLMMD